MANHKPPARAAEPSAIRVTVHPPERRRRHSSVVAAQACCCCCCCCCLHTIGGLIGGLVGSLLRVRPSPPPVREPAEGSPFPFRRDELEPTFTLSPALVYWVLFSLLSMGTFLYFVTAHGGGNDPIWAGIGTVLVMPGIQLGASLLALLVVALCPAALVPDKPAAVVRIGKISLWAFVGGLVGMGLMLPLLWM
jgi:hypothetical protein